MERSTSVVGPTIYTLKVREYLFFAQFGLTTRICASSWRGALHILLQAMAIAVRVAHKLNDPSFVRKPVEKGCGHFVIGKNGQQLKLVERG